MNWTQFTPGWQRHQCLLLILTTCNKDIFLSFSNTKKAIELKCNYCSPGFDMVSGKYQVRISNWLCVTKAYSSPELNLFGSPYEFGKKIRLLCKYVLECVSPHPLDKWIWKKLEKVVPFEEWMERGHKTIEIPDSCRVGFTTQLHGGQLRSCSRNGAYTSSLFCYPVTTLFKQRCESKVTMICIIDILYGA